MNGKVDPCASNLWGLSALSCDICHKYFNGRKPYYEHLQSNNHKKKLKEKAVLDITSQESFKPQLQTLQSDNAIKDKDLESKNIVDDYQYRKLIGSSTQLQTLQSDNVYKDKDLESKNIVDDYQYSKLSGSSETNKPIVSTGWNSVESSVLSTFLFPESNEKECEQFYVECAVCQLYFTSQNTAFVHFNSSDHKDKVARHQEIDELYNCIKNIDIQEIVENLCGMPSLNPLEKNAKSSTINIPPVSSKQRIVEASSSKLPQGDHMAKEKKLLPGCEICGVTSFPSVISSLNHLSTTEHCRRVAMKSEAARLSCNISNESLIVPSPFGTSQKLAETSHFNLAPVSSHIDPLYSDYFYRTGKQEEKSSSGNFLNPIGYECKKVIAVL